LVSYPAAANQTWNQSKVANSGATASKYGSGNCNINVNEPEHELMIPNLEHPEGKFRKSLESKDTRGL
jgi:hypothetical protein